MRCNCDCVDEARWEKLDKVKRIIAFCIGGLIIVVSFLSILNPSAYDSGTGSNAFIRPLGIITSLWNILFAFLIVLVQLRWTDWVGMRFGFLLSPLFRCRRAASLPVQPASLPVQPAQRPPVTRVQLTTIAHARQGLLCASHF